MPINDLLYRGNSGMFSDLVYRGNPGEITPVNDNGLTEKLLGSGVAVSPEESASFFKDNDLRWGETLRGDDSPNKLPTIYINDKKFEAATGKKVTPEIRKKYVLSESLHNLKDVDPERYNRLREAATSNKDYMKWAEDSYRRALSEGEGRSFKDWHDHSRFDQIIGGYLFAKDPDFPTMKGWDREVLPFGTPFKKELEKLRLELNIK